jgi:flagellar basal body rod protein FlgB
VKCKEYAYNSNLVEVRENLKTLTNSMEIYARVSMVNDYFRQHKEVLQSQID